MMTTVNPSTYPLFSFNAPLNRGGEHTWVRLIPGDIYISCQDCGVLRTDLSAAEICPGRARTDILTAPADEPVTNVPLSAIPGSGVTPW